ncbi:MAG: hypothetical protein KC503_27340 [Myxococcales bacterium]|nr:hypothetical protein [Myxococcales bacterium]
MKASRASGLSALYALCSLCAALAATTPASAAPAAKKRETRRTPQLIKKPCGRVPAQGCCSGGRLYYCRRGRLAALDCRARPRCGWHPRGFYDCNTAGAVDPSGKYAKACFFGKKNERAKAPLPPAPSHCGYVTVEGCCTKDNALRYCNEGRVYEVKCSLNPACGWRGVAQLYNCGTSGGKDPRGRHPRACAALSKSRSKSKTKTKTKTE